MATNGITDAGAQPVPRLGARKRRWGEDAIKWSLVVCAFVSVATTIAIVIALLEPAIEFFREINFIDFITGDRWAPLFEPPDFGVLPLLAGTISVTIWATLV